MLPRILNISQICKVTLEEQGWREPGSGPRRSKCRLHITAITLLTAAPITILPPPSRRPCVRVVHSCLLIYIPKYFSGDSIPTHATMKKTWPKCTHTCTHKTVPRTVRYLSISLLQYFRSVEFVVL